ncbi:diguanylate cyclase domain-containing protein [Limnoraphis robusta]|uniref:Diguanylate cyclase n=2 Tax=Limnoraphis TaxID=1332112 RepID=A0ABU5U334_9CYAN|nr:diguanylate cyclase [Limnoraphis robusta]MEA5521043.1 diguanylate cyclase [Limnoraphis robusta CCNP1315]
MHKFLCPCCSEPLLVHISDHKKVGFCVRCHQEMPLLEHYGCSGITPYTEVELNSNFSVFDLNNIKQFTEQFLQTGLEGIFILDTDKKITFLNSKMAEMLGYTIEEMINKSLRNFLDQDHPAFAQLCSYKNLSSQEERYEIKLYHKNSQFIWVKLSVNVLRDQDNQFQGYLCRAIDISDRKQMEQDIKQQNRREQALNRLTQVMRSSFNLEIVFAAAVEEIGRLFAVLSVQIVEYLSDEQCWLSRAEYRSPEAELALNSDQNLEPIKKLDHPQLLRFDDRKILKFERDKSSIPLKVPAHITESLTSNPEVKIDAHKIEQFMQNCPGAWLPVPLYSQSEIWGSLSMVMKNPGYSWQESDLKLIYSFANQLSIAIHQASLYQQLEEAKKKLKYLSGVDSFTQLLNRQSFNDYLYKKWEHLCQESLPLSMVLCDLNYYQFYRETYGEHSAGQFIKQVAEAINTAVKNPHHIVARYDETEFAVLLPKAHSTQAVQLVETIQTKVEKIKLTPESRCEKQYLSMSFGIASTIPKPASSPEQLLEAAEQALDHGASQLCKCLLSKKLG